MSVVLLFYVFRGELKALPFPELLCVRLSCKSLLGKRYREVFPCGGQGSGMGREGVWPKEGRGEGLHGHHRSAPPVLSPPREAGSDGVTGAAPAQPSPRGADRAWGIRGELFKVTLTARPRAGARAG